MVRRHFGICAVQTEFVIKWDLCRTGSCLAATEPMGAYDCRSRERRGAGKLGSANAPTATPTDSL